MGHAEAFFGINVRPSPSLQCWGERGQTGSSLPLKIPNLVSQVSLVKQVSENVPPVPHGALRLLQRSKAGHLVEVRLPAEIRAVRLSRIESRTTAQGDTVSAHAAINLDEADFLKNLTLRKSIHARERGQCFYCLRSTAPSVCCLDHVVPQARSGCNSYRNLVSSCMECNAQKGKTAADDFLRRLYRERRLTATELAARLRALDALTSGKLRPSLP